MPLTQILHLLREQDQQRDSVVASDAASTSKSLPGAASNSESNSENSTLPNITANINNGHEQRRTTGAPTTKPKPDLNKPLPPLPTNQSDTETSDVDRNEKYSSKSSSKTSTKTASAPSSPSKASSTTLLSNESLHRHDVSDASIAAVLDRLADDDRDIIVRALNSVRLDPLNNTIAPANQRKTGGLEGRSSLWPSAAVDAEKKEKNAKHKRRWLSRWPWKSGKRSKGRTSSARDNASSSSPCSHCPSPHATTAAAHASEGNTATRTTRTNLPIGGSGTAAKLLRKTAQGKRGRSRQTQRDALKEQARRQMHARTRGQAQTQTLGTRALKTRARSPTAMDERWDTTNTLLTLSQTTSVL